MVGAVDFRSAERSRLFAGERKAANGEVLTIQTSVCHDDQQRDVAGRRIKMMIRTMLFKYVIDDSYCSGRGNGL